MGVWEIHIEGFKKVITALDALTSEVALEFAERGLKVSAINEARTVLTEAFLPREAFETYEGTGVIGVKPSALMKVLKNMKVKKGQKGLLKIEEADNLLLLHFKKPTGAVKTYTLGVYDFEPEDYGTPEIPFSATAVLDAAVLKEVLNDVKDVYEGIRIKAAGNKLTFISEGDIKAYNYTLTPEDEGVHSIKGEGLTGISWAYLKDITKAAGKDAVTLEWAEWAPLKVSFPVMIDEETPAGFISILVAPFVDED